MKSPIPRRTFLNQLGTGAVTIGLGCPLLAEAPPPAAVNAAPAVPLEEALKKAESANRFTNNWLSDLFDAIEAEVEPATRVKLLEACGRGCYRRHSFKQAIAEEGRGDVDKLVAALGRNFGVRPEGDLVHITYGGGKCFCPAARNRPARPNDLHCECTRATHQAIWEAAMGRTFHIELAETVRRGGKRCHLIVHLT